MKNFYRFLLPVFLLLSVEAKSQAYTYHPFPDSNFVWEGVTRCYGLGQVDNRYWSLSIAQDTIINGLTYHTVGNGNWTAGCLREDSSKRVYVIWDGDTSMQERLLYDFSFTVGDTFLLSFKSLTVYKVDTPVYNGVPRRTIYLTDSSVYWGYDRDQWIEGIGSYLNPFGWWPWYGAGNCLVSWLCYALNDSVIIYQNEADCFGVTSVVDASGYLSVIIYPNPATTTFTLQLSSSPITETHLMLYDALGREVKREPITAQTTILNRNNLTAGIYYWQLQSGGRSTARGKILFEQ